VVFCTKAPVAQRSIASVLGFPPWDCPHVPHFTLVFYNAVRSGGKPPLQKLRKLLRDGGDETAGAVVRVMTTFLWASKDKSVTFFWMHGAAFEVMMADNWRLCLWRTDSWERVTEGLELRGA
jgi:hypothetical protein